MIGEPRHPALRALYVPARWVFGMRTLGLMWFDLIRLRARAKHLFRRNVTSPADRLHVGCGTRRVSGWLNVDVVGSEYDVDLGSRLPWREDSFDALVGQHVIEHLELFSELLPFLRELRRVLRPRAELWLSCPDMEKVCRAYVDERLPELIADRHSRNEYTLQGAPASHVMNDLFHQYGEHKNLYDFPLLSWALDQAGFVEVRRVEEADLLARFPEFPARNDDHQSLYVAARAPR